MPRFVLLLAALASLGLVGCGGGEGGCSGFSFQPSGDYAGSYTAVFTPQAGDRLDFAFTVASDGTLNGTVTDPTPDPDTEGTATGSANDVVGCRPQAPGRALRIDYTLDRVLGAVTATRTGSGELAGRYDTGGGSLVVTRVGD